MPRKRSNTKRRKLPGVENWQLDYILTGSGPKIETMETVGWDFHSTWEQVKDSDFIKQWKQENGQTFYEINHA